MQGWKYAYAMSQSSTHGKFYTCPQFHSATACPLEAGQWYNLCNESVSPVAPIFCNTSRNLHSRFSTSEAGSFALNHGNLRFESHASVISADSHGGLGDLPQTWPATCLLSADMNRSPCIDTQSSPLALSDSQWGITNLLAESSGIHPTPPRRASRRRVTHSSTTLPFAGSAQGVYCKR
ncbi:hypothetical protein F4808DRAFT_424025 [Astrocystis sublimbata]|nr:hypothetical protein F4808DRAFT_424025 [Astrocystis sublimbata]